VTVECGMRRCWRSLWSGSLALLIITCTSRVNANVVMQRFLEDQYGPGTRVVVGFIGDSQHVVVLVGGPGFDSLPDSMIDSKAREVAGLRPDGSEGSCLMHVERDLLGSAGHGSRSLGLRSMSQG